MTTIELTCLIACIVTAVCAVIAVAAAASAAYMARRAAADARNTAKLLAAAQARDAAGPVPLRIPPRDEVGAARVLRSAESLRPVD